MEKRKKETYRLRDEITGELHETLYTIAIEESDNDIPGLVWFYLVSEYEDDNIEYEQKYDLYYAEITNNQEGRLA